MELDLEIYELIKKLGGTMKIEAGIVNVTMPDGSEWDFTEVKKVAKV